MRGVSLPVFDTPSTALPRRSSGDSICDPRYRSNPAGILGWQERYDNVGFHKALIADSKAAFHPT